MTTPTFNQKLIEMNDSMKYLFGFHLAIIALVLIGCGGCGGVKRDTVSIPNENIIQSPTTLPDYEKDSISKQNYQELKLTPIDRKKVLDHYVYYTRDTTFRNKGEHSIYLFNGKEEKKIKVDNDYEITITPNEKYFTLSKLVEKSKNKFEFEVELRDFNNEILAKGNIPASFNDYYDEFKDAIYPMEDGSGFLQEGRRLGGDLFFSVYKIREDKFYKKFTYDKTTGRNYANILVNSGIRMNETGTEFVVLSEKRDHTFETLDILNESGNLIWSKKLTQFTYSLSENNDKNIYGFSDNRIYLNEYRKTNKAYSVIIFNLKDKTEIKIDNIIFENYFRSGRNSIFISKNAIYIDAIERIDSVIIDTKKFEKLLSNVCIYNNQLLIGCKKNMIYNYNLKTNELKLMRFKSEIEKYLSLKNSKLLIENITDRFTNRIKIKSPFLYLIQN